MSLLELNDSLTITVTYPPVERTLSEYVQMLFSETVPTTVDRTITSSFNLIDGDLIARILFEFSEIGDAFEVAELLAPEPIRGRYVGSNLDIQDLLARTVEEGSGVAVRVLQSSLISNDQLSPARELLRAFTDVLSMMDVQGVARTQSRLLNEGLFVSDLISPLIFRTVSRTLVSRATLSDDIKLEYNLMRTLFSQFDVVDQLQILSAVIKQRTLASQFEISDELMTSAGRLHILLDTLGVQDSETVERKTYRGLVNSVLVSDSIAREYMFLRILIDNTETLDEIFPTVARFISVLVKIEFNVSLAPIIMGVRKDDS